MCKIGTTNILVIKTKYAAFLLHEGDWINFHWRGGGGGGGAGYSAVSISASRKSVEFTSYRETVPL